MSSTLSESDSKDLLARHGIPFAPEEMVTTPEDAVAFLTWLQSPEARAIFAAQGFRIP